jgi:hypothetical protein
MPPEQDASGSFQPTHPWIATPQVGELVGQQPALTAGRQALPQLGGQHQRGAAKAHPNERRNAASNLHHAGRTAKPDSRSHFTHLAAHLI